MDAEHEQPSLANQLARDAAGKLARQALTKVAAIVGAKAGVIIAVVLAIMLIVLLLVIVIVSVAGAGFQASTAVWPVSVKTDVAGNYHASGWSISSRYGWRDDPLGGGSAFHDGLDLANPEGTCPFGYHCGAPAMFDGQVTYVGWDQAAAGDPSKTGGGEMVILQNGQDDHQTIYAHLEPYRLYVQLQGRITDTFGRYDTYRDYQPIGRGPLKPDLRNGGIEMTCQNDMPNFIPTRSGAGTVVFLYDRPANCMTTVVWGQHGDDWQGWIPDQPSASGGQRAELRWQTPIDPGKRAQDVALRFRAHLVPPPPPPITDTATLTPEPVLPHPQAVSRFSGAMLPGRGSVVAGEVAQRMPTPLASALSLNGKPQSCTTLAGGWARCVWDFATIPSERERFAAAPDTWLVAAQSPASTPALERNDEQEQETGPTISPVPLLPIQSFTKMTATPALATPTPRPTNLPQGIAAPQLGIGGRARQLDTQVPTPVPTAPPAAPQISILPAMPPQLMLRNPNANIPDHLGVTLTITSQSEENIQVNLRRESPAIASAADVDTTVIAVVPGVLQNYLAPGFGVTVAPGTAPGIQVCVTVAWQGLTSHDSGSEHVCTVTLDPNALPTSPALPTAEPGHGPSAPPNCAPLPLVRLPNVTAPQPRLIAPAAESFAAVRAEIQQRTGIDALAVLADVLRTPSFTTGKAGVLNTSWHKAGRAIDLNVGGSFTRVAEGRRFRLFVNNVDITAIFESHGWQRIPVQSDSPEWWHYEWHPDGIAWTSAMIQIWDLPTLNAAFPGIDWSAISCQAGSTPGSGEPILTDQETADMCVLGAPTFGGTVEMVDGCGPPIQVGDNAYQLDSRLGFVGLSGHTTGPHLHLGLKVKSYDGSWPMINICTPEWLQGRIAPADADCFTDMADPLAFLPQAPANTRLGGDGATPLQKPGVDGSHPAGMTPTPLIPEGAPYQLPPPNYPGALVFTPVPGATPIGQYWSPYADGGQYGGGGVGAWFCANVWRGFPWCN